MRLASPPSAALLQVSLGSPQRVGGGAATISFTAAGSPLHAIFVASQRLDRQLSLIFNNGCFTFQERVIKHSAYTSGHPVHMRDMAEYTNYYESSLPSMVA